MSGILGQSTQSVSKSGSKTIVNVTIDDIVSNGKYLATEENQGNLDSITGALEVINYEHHEIHSGSHYFIEGYTTLGNAGTLYVKLVTPDTTKWAHFGWRINSSGILTTTLVEAPTGGMTGGSGVTPVNNNRNSSNVSGIVITSGATAPTGGTIISQESFGSKSAGGSITRADEIILKQNTIYARTFLSGTASNIVGFKASWYEHTNRN